MNKAVDASSRIADFILKLGVYAVGRATPDSPDAYPAAPGLARRQGCPSARPCAPWCRRNPVRQVRLGRGGNLPPMPVRRCPLCRHRADRFPGDQSWTARIAAHRSRRPSSWTTVETGDLSAEPRRRPHTATLVDDLGGWLTGALDRRGWDRPDGRRRRRIAHRRHRIHRPPPAGHPRSD